MSATTALKWFKSSYSGSDGGQCLEMAVAWRKSSYSGGDGDACVEMAVGPDTVHVRDSKVQDGPVLDVAPASWAQLTGWVSE
ncbi:DUF397 domain-containing protein [Streptomyces venezuelae]|uniref:DUF397 domain-containing protein n=1 Tax=Streptomyces venezuelae TaxID=54571 RepID=A0A5P2DLK7_STRVZ|nr:DUF397 domain-containing protein [Streptomyces venezuelae]QES55996.1 DUF397 domain-containing protein [Streptomyces venezuelae]